MDVPEPNITDAPVSATSLVEQLVTEDYPEPRLIAQILALGSEAVEPLRALVRRDCEDEADFEAVGLAAELLGSLGVTDAIPDLLGLFRRIDEDILEVLAPVLGEFGPQVIEPALEIARDVSLPWYARGTAIEAARMAAGQDPAARATVAHTLRELLANLVRSGEEAVARAKARSSAGAEVDDDDQDEDDGLEPDFSEKTTTLVWDLAGLADPQARDLINAAYEADLVDTWLFRKRDVDELYRTGGRNYDARKPFLSRYEIEYKEHQETERRREERKRQEAEAARTRASAPARPPIASRKPSQPLPPLLPAAAKILPKTTTQPRPGRNDPCWCGSGKKYKQCHLRRDEG